MSHLVTLFSNIKRFLNILGRDGSCESLTPFTTSGTSPMTLSSTRSKSGTNSIKFSGTAQTGFRFKDYATQLDSTKRYILAGWVYFESFTSGEGVIGLFDVGTSISRYLANANTSIVGSWQLVYVKIPTANTLVGVGFKLLFGAGASSTNVAYYDSIRLYELSAAEYAAIGTTYNTSAQIDSFIPYVDSL